jgi:hypothetical protein
VGAAEGGAVAAVSDATARPSGEYTVSALPLHPFGVPDLVWPPEVCEACYQPQWSDALRDWEFVEDAARPCAACQVRGVRGPGRHGRGSR